MTGDTKAIATLRVGIASPAEAKARTLAIARGELRPMADEPNIWFASTESFARILSGKNRQLLATIATQRPTSLQALAAETGRRTTNLSRTLRTMAQYGLVVLHRGAGGRVRPEVAYGAISLVLPLAITPLVLAEALCDPAKTGRARAVSLATDVRSEPRGQP